MTAIAPTRLTTTAYWITTVVLATECLAGGVMGALQMEPFLGTATHLSYPAYFMPIPGGWCVSAGVILLAPRLARLKEWAYAGLVFNYTGAAASHLAVGDDAKTLVAPAFFLFLTGRCGLLSAATSPLPQVVPVAVASSSTG